MQFKDGRSAAAAVAVAVAVASMMTLAGCTAGPGAGTSSASSTSSSTPSTSAGTAVSTSTVAAAKALLAKYKDNPTFVAPGPSLNAKKLAGKKVLVIDVDQVAQQIVSINAGLKSAAKAAGLSISFYNGQDTPSTLQQGIEQGISQKVDAIILNGVPPALVPTPISKAASAGIPVIAATTGTNLTQSGIFGSSSPDFTLTGELMASAAIAQQNGGEVRAGVIKFTNPAVPDAIAGITSVFKGCDGHCMITRTNTIEPQNWPTQVPGTASAMVKADPQMNTLFGVVDDTLGQFAAAGVKSAQSTSVKVIGAQGSGAAPLNVVKSSSIYVADPGQSALWIGWGAIDQTMRALLKMGAGKDVTPPRYLDGPALANVDVSNPDSVYGNAYIAGFEKLWGLG